MIRPPTNCIHVNFSPKKINAKMDVKTGLKFRKTPALDAPRFWIPIFQRSIQTIVEIVPVYNSAKTKDASIADTESEEALNGNNSVSPNTPE